MLFPYKHGGNAEHGSLVSEANVLAVRGFGAMGTLSWGWDVRMLPALGKVQEPQEQGGSRGGGVRTVGKGVTREARGPTAGLVS